MTNNQGSPYIRPAVQAPVNVDRNSPVPIYHQLAEQLATAIHEGILQPGDFLEGEVSLARRFDISRPTVRRSIGVLVARGLVVRRRGVGTTVSPQAVHRRSDNGSLFDDLTAAGLEPATTVLRLAFGQVEPRIAHAMDLDPATPLVALVRLRLVNQVPMAILRNWLALPLRDLAVIDLEEHGLYELLRQRGIWPAVAQQTIGSRSATSDEHRLLGLGRGEPILDVTQLAFDTDGRPIEYGEHSYRSDRYRFEVIVKPIPSAA